MATRKKSGLWIEETAAIMRVSLPEAQRYVYDQAYDDVGLGLCIARQEQERESWSAPDRTTAIRTKTT